MSTIIHPPFSPSQAATHDYERTAAGLRALGWRVGTSSGQDIGMGSVIYATRLYGVLAAVEALDSTLTFTRSGR